jgi:hypothetical protein
MAVITRDFDTYSLLLIGGKTGKADMTARIDCYQLGRLVGMITFFADVAMTITCQSTHMGPIISYPMSQFPAVMDTLRQEKPLWLVLNDATMFGYVGTKTREPVGDLEP